MHSINPSPVRFGSWGLDTTIRRATEAPKSTPDELTNALADLETIIDQRNGNHGWRNAVEVRAIGLPPEILAPFETKFQEIIAAGNPAMLTAMFRGFARSFLYVPADTLVQALDTQLKTLGINPNQKPPSTEPIYAEAPKKPWWKLWG